MKKLLTVVTCLVLSVSIAQAGKVKFGAHVGGTAGSDIVTPGPAYGIQFGGNLNNIVGMEISGSKFSDDLDEEENGSVDVTSIAGTLQVGGTIANTIKIYGGAGPDIHMFDVDATFAETLAGGTGFTDDQIAQGMGYASSASLNAAAAMLGYDLELEIDDAVGFHVCAGLEISAGPTMFFAEFRQTFLELEGTYTVSVSGSGLTLSQSNDYKTDMDYGMGRLGFSFAF